jgi:DNA-binding IclR family transcriptional regulator
MDNDWTVISELDLRERDINLLQAINEEELTNFSFEGLKRRLKIHQETLSRILNRLANQEILKKTKKGYTLTPKAKKLLKSQSSDSNTPTLKLLKTLLPP